MFEEVFDFFKFESGFGFRVLANDFFNLFRVKSQGEVVNNLLDFLKKNGIKATFFFSSRNVNKYSAVIKKLVDEGHELASHGHNHLLLPNYSFGRVLGELRKSRETLLHFSDEIIGFRPPFLVSSGKVVNAAGKAGFKYLSSKIGGDSFQYSNGLREFPVFDYYDWKWVRVRADKLKKMPVNKAKSKQVLLFHPWLLKNDFDIVKKRKVLRVNDLFKKKGVGLSFDVY